MLSLMTRPSPHPVCSFFLMEACNMASIKWATGTGLEVTFPNQLLEKKEPSSSQGLEKPLDELLFVSSHIPHSRLLPQFDHAVSC